MKVVEFRGVPVSACNGPTEVSKSARDGDPSLLTPPRLSHFFSLFFPLFEKVLIS
jgi:hypothetical protein